MGVEPLTGWLWKVIEPILIELISIELIFIELMFTELMFTEPISIEPISIEPMSGRCRWLGQFIELIFDRYQVVARRLEHTLQTLIFFVLSTTFWIELEVSSNLPDKRARAGDKFLDCGSCQILEWCEDFGDSGVGAVPLSHESAVPPGL
jgi:hypothetical protein